MAINFKIEVCLLLKGMQTFPLNHKIQLELKINLDLGDLIMHMTEWDSETVTGKQKKGECRYETRPLQHAYSWPSLKCHSGVLEWTLKLIGIPSATWSTVSTRYAKCNAQQGQKMKQSLSHAHKNLHSSVVFLCGQNTEL